MQQAILMVIQATKKVLDAPGVEVWRSYLEKLHRKRDATKLGCSTHFVLGKVSLERKGNDILPYFNNRDLNWHMSMKIWENYYYILKLDILLTWQFYLYEIRTADKVTWEIMCTQRYSWNNNLIGKVY